MWFGGLRGAMAFALSLNVPTPAQRAILTTTLIIVLFTVLVLGGATIPLLEFLDIPRGEVSSPIDRENDEKDFVATNWFMKLDCQYIRPFITRRGQDHSIQRDQEPTPLPKTSTKASFTDDDDHVSFETADTSLALENSETNENENEVKSSSDSDSAEFDSNGSGILLSPRAFQKLKDKKSKSSNDSIKLEEI